MAKILNERTGKNAAKTASKGLKHPDKLSDDEIKKISGSALSQRKKPKK